MEISLNKVGRAQRRKIVGCQPFGREQVGFALPIFSHSTGPIIPFVQVNDEITGRITEFLSLDDAKPQIIPVAGHSVAVGDEKIYAFMASLEEIRVGTLDALRTALEQFAEANASRAGLVLQIRELIGSHEEKKIARIRMQTLLLEEQGKIAAQSFYEGSVLRAVLWECLVSIALNREMARRILSVRSRLRAQVTANGSIALDLSALSPDDQAAIDQEALIERMLLEFEPEPAKTIRARNSYRNDFRHESKALLDQIGRTRRQEERVSILMSAILDNPLVGKAALLEYGKDKGKFADWTLKELRKIFVDTNWPSDERIIASLIPRLFTKQYPLTRGDLLFYLAKHLAKWPLINLSIKKTLDRTKSMFVDFRRRDVEDALDQHRMPKMTVRPF